MTEIVQPLGSRVLVRVLAAESVTASGLSVLDTAEVRVADDDHLIIETLDLLAILRDEPAAAAAA